MERLFSQILAISVDFFPANSIIGGHGIARDLSENEPNILKRKGNAVLQKSQIIRKGPVEPPSDDIDLVVQFTESPAQLVQPRDGDGNFLHMILIIVPDVAENVRDVLGSASLFDE